MSNAHDRYDYAILGAGGAGLSLALHMVKAGICEDKTLLLLDKDAKDKNDRTWSFWSKEPTMYDSIIEHSWSALDVHSSHGSHALKVDPYIYHKLQGIDFYDFVRRELSQCPNVEWIESEVLSTTEGNLVTINATTGTYIAGHIFLSYASMPPLEHHFLTLQHFGGWFVSTQEDVFDPERATFMDFRIEQVQGETRFCYVLPTSKREALVEVAIYSSTVWNKERYNTLLSRYVQDFTDVNEYVVREREYGVIPMTDYPLWKRDTDLVTHIGTAGGAVKPSTGYAFARMQRQSKHLVSFIDSGQPWSKYKSLFDSRFRYYDATLLDVLLRQKMDSAAVFHRFFNRNDPNDVLAFLNDESSFATELKICSSMPILPFAKGLMSRL